MNIKVNSSKQEDVSKTVEPQKESSSLALFGSEEKHMLYNSNYQLASERAAVGPQAALNGDLDVSRKVVREMSVNSQTTGIDRHATEKELERTIARFIEKNMPSASSQDRN